MSPISRSGWFGLWFLVLGVLAADQISKYAVEKLTSTGSLRVIIPGLLNLAHTSNPGVAFGLLADSRSPWLAFLLIAFSVATGDKYFPVIVHHLLVRDA